MLHATRGVFPIPIRPCTGTYPWMREIIYGSHFPWITSTIDGLLPTYERFDMSRSRYFLVLDLGTRDLRFQVSHRIDSDQNRINHEIAYYSGCPICADLVDIDCSYLSASYRFFTFLYVFVASFMDCRRNHICHLRVLDHNDG